MPRTRDLRYLIRIKAGPQQIYRALTSATELCRWWLEGAETDATNLGRLRMVWPKIRGEHGGIFPPYVAVGESEGCFVDLEPGRKVAWMWKLHRKAKIIPPLTSFFIRPLRDGCEVTLLHAGFSATPGNDKYFLGCAQGWEDCLAKLKLYLETGQACKSKVLTFAALKASLRKPRPREAALA
ncbi:MAG: SRPBCC domain-containing protein [Elusimicrobia bacterium]|nr:SRPBCC domain-containing protein [Elusimicrobiota bacterium]